MGLPYIAGKLEDLELIKSPNIKAENAVTTDKLKEHLLQMKSSGERATTRR